MAVITSVIATTPENLKTAIFAGLKTYAAVLVDMDRLFERRRTQAERDAMLARLTAEGFQMPIPVADFGEDGRYYMIVNRG